MQPSPKHPTSKKSKTYNQNLKIKKLPTNKLKYISELYKVCTWSINGKKAFIYVTQVSRAVEICNLR